MEEESLEDLAVKRSVLKNFHSLNLGSNFYSWLEDRRKNKELVMEHRKKVKEGFLNLGFSESISLGVSKLSRPSKPGSWKILSYLAAQYIGDLPKRYVEAYHEVGGPPPRHTTLASIIGDFVFCPSTVIALEISKHALSPFFGEEITQAVIGTLQAARIAQPFIRANYWYYYEKHLPSFSVFYSSPMIQAYAVPLSGYDAYLKWKEKTNLKKNEFLSGNVAEKD